MAEKRRDKDRAVLKTGELQVKEKDLYRYRWTDANGKRHSIYAKTLKELPFGLHGQSTIWQLRHVMRDFGYDLDALPC